MLEETWLKANCSMERKLIKDCERLCNYTRLLYDNVMNELGKGCVACIISHSATIMKFYRNLPGQERLQYSTNHLFDKMEH